MPDDRLPNRPAAVRGHHRGDVPAAATSGLIEGVTPGPETGRSGESGRAARSAQPHRTQPHRNTLRAVIAWAALSVLTACASAPDHSALESAPSAPAQPATIVQGCCQGHGTYSPALLAWADRNQALIRTLGQIELRPGRLARVPAAQAKITAALRPLDLVFVHNRHRVSGQLIPGFFTHGAIYLGTPGQLRAAGLWQHPALAPYRNRIASGATWLEAVDGGVRLTRAQVVLNTDAAVILRPRGQDRAAALARGLARIGVPFDMRFDVNDGGAALFCAELIDEMFPATPLPVSPVPLPGRATILIDAIVADSLTGRLPFGLVGYVSAAPEGAVAARGPVALARDLRAAWP